MGDGWLMATFGLAIRLGVAELFFHVAQQQNSAAESRYHRHVISIPLQWLPANHGVRGRGANKMPSQPANASHTMIHTICVLHNGQKPAEKYKQKERNEEKKESTRREGKRRMKTERYKKERNNGGEMTKRNECREGFNAILKVTHGMALSGVSITCEKIKRTQS